MRLILTEQADELAGERRPLALQRCGSCSAVCPMELDIAGALARLRALERAHGGQRCPSARRRPSPPAGSRPRQDRLDGLRRGDGRPRPCAGRHGRGGRGGLATDGPPATARGGAGDVSQGGAGQVDLHHHGRPDAGPRSHDRLRPRERRDYAAALLSRLRPAAGRRRRQPHARRGERPRPGARRSGRRALLRPPQPGRERRGLCQRRDRDHRLSGLRPQPRGERHPTHAALGSARRPRQALRRRAARGGPSLRALRRLPGGTRACPGRASPARQPWPASIA